MQLRTPAVGPRVMIGGEVDEHEHRRMAALALDDPGGCVIVEAVRLDPVGAERLGVEEILDAGCLVKPPRAHKRALGRIERKCLVAAFLERLGQTAVDAIGRDAGQEIREAAERP